MYIYIYLYIYIYIYLYIYILAKLVAIQPLRYQLSLGCRIGALLQHLPHIETAWVKPYYYPYYYFCYCYYFYICQYSCGTSSASEAASAHCRNIYQTQERLGAKLTTITSPSPHYFSSTTLTASSAAPTQPRKPHQHIAAASAKHRKGFMYMCVYINEYIFIYTSSPEPLRHKLRLGSRIGALLQHLPNTGTCLLLLLLLLLLIFFLLPLLLVLCGTNSASEAASAHFCSIYHT